MKRLWLLFDISNGSYPNRNYVWVYTNPVDADRKWENSRSASHAELTPPQEFLQGDPRHPGVYHVWFSNSDIVADLVDIWLLPETDGHPYWLWFTTEKAALAELKENFYKRSYLQPIRIVKC